jgi:hypothetical protein
MRRVTRPGGLVASGVFDFWGGFSASALVYDNGPVLDEGIRALRDDVRIKGRRFPTCRHFKAISPLVVV